MKKEAKTFNRSNYFAVFLSQAVVSIYQMSVCQIPAGMKDQKSQVVGDSLLFGPENPVREQHINRKKTKDRKFAIL